MADAKQVFADELGKMTIDGLKTMGGWIEGAKDFALEQAPLFAQEYVKWYAVDNIVSAIVCLILIFLFAIAASKGASWIFAKSKAVDKNEDEFFDSSYDAGGAATVLMIIGFATRVGSIIGIFVCLFNGADYVKQAAKAHWAPRVVIVEGIKDVITSKTPVCPNK